VAYELNAVIARVGVPRIGVQRTTGDEFEAVGLVRHRFTGNWLS
jgi:hypothetical protein